MISPASWWVPRALSDHYPDNPAVSSAAGSQANAAGWICRPEFGHSNCGPHPPGPPGTQRPGVFGPDLTGVCPGNPAVCHSGLNASPAAHRSGRPPHDVQDRAAAVDSFCRAQQAAFVMVASSAAETEDLWKARKLLSPAAFKIKPHKLSEDVVVPLSLIPDLVSRIESISRKLDLPILCFGHAGDGNIHVNVMYNRQEKREFQAAEQAVKEIFTVVRSWAGPSPANTASASPNPPTSPWSYQRPPFP